MKLKGQANMWRTNFGKTLLTAIFLSQVSLCAHGATANLDISSVPIDPRNAARPNIIFGLDDSGSMDFETMLDTNDGAAWWVRPASGASTFTDGTGRPQFNPTGNSGSDGSNTWYKYAYLFPNGDADDARNLLDGSNEHFAIPPTPAYAWLRSYQYNPIYYNPAVTYTPWDSAYISGATRTFSNATTTAVRSHPWLPTSGSPYTFNLTANVAVNSTANFTFKMFSGMVVPGTKISGMIYRKNGGSWSAVGSGDITLSGTSSDDWDVQIPYYPATYYIVDTSCTVDNLTCITAPDGRKLKRYEVKSGVTFPSGRTYAAELQNFANWFQYYRKRKLMLGSAMGQVLTQVRDVRGGVVKFNSSAAVTMYDFNATSDSLNFRQLLGTVYTNPASGGTPTRDALYYIGQQYMRTDASAPIQYACQRNAAFILTDGFANATSSVSLPTYTRTTYGNGAPFTAIYSNTLADIALYFFTTNLRSTMPTGLVPYDPTNTRPDADRNPNLHMNTYGLTLGAKGSIFGVNTQQTNNPYSYPPTWPNPTQNRNPTAVDDLWHSTINGRGQMYTVTDVTGTVAKIKAMVADLLNKSGSASAVAVSNVNVRAGDNTAYASVYSTGGWYGDLLAFSVNVSTGNVDTNTPNWSARDLLEAKDPNTRNIVTFNPSLGVGKPLRWANLNATMQSQLATIASAPALTNGQKTLSFLRGDRTVEADGYRIRSYIMGDIINAEPVVVRAAQSEYADSGYTLFRNTMDSRKSTIYQAANDGMVHAFDSANGQELWAYMPNLIFSGVSELASPNYTHRYYVDATPTVGDVDFANTSGSSGAANWRTILIGGLRYGGKGYYALDVTDPSVTDENAAAAKVLWEFPNASTSSAVVASLGYSFGKPLVVKTRAYGWVVLVTSGYNSTTTTDGKGHLFVLNPRNGQVLKELVTSDGTVTNQANLGQISGFVLNGQQDLTVEQVYGGDMLGNVWRFDLSSSSPASWSVARLATLTDSSSTPQPITSAPELVTVKNKRVVLVGTGRLLGDSNITSTATQSFYAMVDDGTATPTISPLRTKLVRKNMTVASGGIRNINSDAINWTTSYGWYFDFPAGERVTGDPTVVYGTLIFTTNQPSPVACSSGSFLYAVDVSTGGQVAASNFATGEGPWSGKSLAQSLSTRPVVVVLPNGQINSLVRSADGGIMSNRLPLSWNRKVKKVSWKEIIR